MKYTRKVKIISTRHMYSALKISALVSLFVFFSIIKDIHPNRLVISKLLKKHTKVKKYLNLICNIYLLIIIKSNTISHPRTMMIKSFNTTITNFAMRYSGRSNNEACSAKLQFISNTSYKITSV